MIISGRRIADLVTAGEIKIEPFDPTRLQPVSYDVCLQPTLQVYTELARDADQIAYLDLHNKNPTLLLTIPAEGLILRPDRVYLGATVERFDVGRYWARIEGVSSLGRLGLSCHITAGWVDPGFRGTLTLELSVVQPTKIYPGMRIAQVCFGAVDGEVDLYRGRYQDQEEPTASRSHLDPPSPR